MSINSKPFMAKPQKGRRRKEKEVEEKRDEKEVSG